MPIQSISKPINSPTFSQKVQDKKSEDNLSSGSAWVEPPKSAKTPTKVKVGATLTTLAGVGAAMAITLKGKRHSLDIKRMFKTNPKNWAIFKVKYNSEKKEVEKLVVGLAVSSVAGGLIGGAIFDKKENMNAKYREGIIQLVGNIFTPLLCVAGGMRMFNKYEPKILGSMKFLKGKTKALPVLAASATCLVLGIFMGNKVGNTINEKAFNVKDNRKIKLADMSPHIDDLCLAISLVAANSKAGPIVSRLIPLALLVAGISTGIAQERPERLKPNETNAQL